MDFSRVVSSANGFILTPRFSRIVALGQQREVRNHTQLFREAPPSASNVGIGTLRLDPVCLAKLNGTAVYFELESYIWKSLRANAPKRRRQGAGLMSNKRFIMK